MKDFYDIVRHARDWAERAGCGAKHRFGLATLVEANGSSYRRPGARMLITPDGQCSGSLSGGCLEEEVAQEALAVIATGVPRLLRFDTRKRFGCHGEISIFIERAGANFFQDMAVRLERRNEFALKTSFASEPFGTSIRASGEHEQESGALLHQVHPPLRLYIVGDGPDSAPIAAMAATLGWIPLPVPESEELDLAPDNYTAAVIKTHNYGRDFAALQRLLPMNLRYVGLMGPLRRRDQLLNHLLDLGVSINAGFFAPAGLDLHSETPAEIALAIVSEIQRVFAGGIGCSLRERKVGIHSTVASNESVAPVRVN